MTCQLLFCQLFPPVEHQVLQLTNFILSNTTLPSLKLLPDQVPLYISVWSNAQTVFSPLGGTEELWEW